MSERCPSCHRLWKKHLGIEGTCRQLLELREALHRIMMVEHILDDGRTSHVRENSMRRKIAVDALLQNFEDVN